MKTPLTLPPCLIEGAKLLFPTLDFSRIKFFYNQGAVSPLTSVFWNRTEIVLNGTTPRWAKDPCQQQTFIILCHELVHALQGQGRMIVHHAASWTCRLLHGQSKGSQNCIEREAYDYEALLTAWFARQRNSFPSTLVEPCQCVNDGLGGVAASLAFRNDTFARLVAEDPSIVKRSAGCTPWDCARPGSVREILGYIVGTFAMGVSAATALVDGVVSAIGAALGAAGGVAGGALIGASILWPLGAIIGWFAGAVIGALIGSFIIQLVGWVIGLLEDEGGGLNMMFSTDGGAIFGTKVSFDRSCEPMSLSFGKRMVPSPGTTQWVIVDRLAVAWTGTDNRVNLMTLPINPAAPLAARAAFEKSEDCGPAVTHIGVRLHVVWQGTDNRLNEVTTHDGLALANKHTLPTLSPDDASPAICLGNGRAVMTYIGTDDRINVMSSQNGLDWGNKITLGEKAESQSTVAVTATVGDGFAIAWTGTDDEHHLNLMLMLVHPTTGIITPGAKFVLNDTSATNAGPALAFGNGLLCLAWTGRDGRVNFMTSRDLGLTFGSRVALNEESRSDCGPALTVKEAESGVIPEIICIGWTGTGW